MTKHGRLIDADALIDIFEDRLEKIRNRYGDYSGEAGVCAGALHLIRIQPTIEPERKKGEWEQVEVNYLDDMDADIKESMAIASMYCPICKRYHNEVYLYGVPTYGVNYCPNCGAKNLKGE